MSSQTSPWDLIIQVCLTEKLGWCPGKDGEPWLTMAAIARCTGRAETDLARKFSGCRRHPSLKGFYKITDLEAKDGEEEGETVA